LLLTTLGCGRELYTPSDAACWRDAAEDLGCHQNLPESSCLSARGTFITLKPGSTACQCPTVDAHCPCTSSTECQGYCELPGVSGSQCVYAPGECSSFQTMLSCVCVVGENRTLGLGPGEVTETCVR
jgi:hypothetical protein